MLISFSGIFHKGSWMRLQVESCALRERGLADGTWANRVSHLRSYVTFTTYYGASDFPVLLGVLLRFIAFLGRGPYTYRSVTNLLASIRWFNSFLAPSSAKVFEAVLVTASLKGLKAQLSRPVRQKLPFSVEHLLKLFYVLDFSDVKQLACWCAMLLAFFGCFRLSNLVPASKNKFDPLKQLRRNDIKFEDKFVLVYYKWSKTNQHAKKVSWVPICPVADDKFNIKLYLKLLMSVVNVQSDAPLFSFNNNNYHTRYSLIRMLDMCIFKAGLPLADYSWHSFRRGAAVFAFELGLADSAVQLLGDWSSPAFKHYLEFAYIRKVSVAKKIAKNFEYQVKQL